MASLLLSIGLISFLNRREELIVPSWLLESIMTGMASAFAVVASRMWPIKQLLLTFAPPAVAPITITLSAVVTPLPASNPKAVFPLLVVLKMSAPTPMAVLAPPLVLSWSA